MFRADNVLYRYVLLSCPEVSEGKDDDDERTSALANSPEESSSLKTRCWRRQPIIIVSRELGATAATVGRFLRLSRSMSLLFDIMCLGSSVTLKGLRCC